MSAPKTVAFSCWGYPNIRGTHTKSIELTSQSHCSIKGTCILGVRAEFPRAQLFSLSGRVEITLSACGISDSFHATINPGYGHWDTLIIRKSNFRARDTLAINADKGAADISRELIKVLTDPDTRLQITIAQCDEELESLTRNGLLVLVPMPLGNPLDISFRALIELERADILATEDTREARNVLKRYGIRKPCISYHDVNEKDRVPELIRMLQQGKRIAVMSEAGTPGISDPGFRITQAAIESGIEVISIPGPVAAVVALTSSGLPTDAFLFLGFLPRTHGKRKTALQEIKAVTHTIVIYEAPHRIIDCLADCIEILGNRQACLARELTKPYEQFIRGTLSEIRERILTEQLAIGEMSLVIHGAEATLKENPEDVALFIKTQLAAGMKVKEIRDMVLAKGIYYGTKHELYELILTLKEQTSDSSVDSVEMELP